MLRNAIFHYGVDSLRGSARVKKELEKRNIMGSQRVVVSFIISLFLWISGCFTLPRGRSEINTDIIHSDVEFRKIVGALQNEVGREIDGALFRLQENGINIPGGRIATELPVALPPLLFPGVVFQPHTVEELDRYQHERIDPFVAYSLSYRDIMKWLDMVLVKFHIAYRDEGFDHKVFFVVDKNKGGIIAKVVVAFVPVRTREKVYLWDVALGFVDGAVSQGGKEAVKALGF